MRRARCPRATTLCDRQGEVVRKGMQVTIVTYGTMIYVCEAAARSSGSTPRSSTCARCAARRRYDLHVREENGPLPDRSRSDALFRLRRGALPTIQEECFWDLEAPIGRVPAGYAVSARVRVGVFPGPARVATGSRP